MIGEQNPYKGAIVDIKNHAIALDAEITSFKQGSSELSQDDLLSLVSKGLDTIICRANGANLVVALRSAPKEKDTDETI